MIAAKPSSSSSVRDQPVARLPQPDAPRSTQPCELPIVPGVQLSACFRQPRIGGDFFDVVHCGNYLFLILTDIAGERETSQGVAAEVQEAFRQQAAACVVTPIINETETAVEMLRTINGAVLAASGGVRCSPTFVAIYNLELHLLTYINAGSPGALLLSDGHVTQVPSSGIPLGLFTHLTHDPFPIAMQPGSRLVLVSKGVLESGQRKAEFGLAGASGYLRQHPQDSADNICSGILAAAEGDGSATIGSRLRNLARITRVAFPLRDEEQDMTVLAIARV